MSDIAAVRPGARCLFQRRIRATGLALALVTAAAAASEVEEDASSHAVERREAGRFVVRYSPGEATAGEADHRAREADTALGEMERAMGITVPGPVTLILHVDDETLRRRTGAPAGSEALTVGRATVHQTMQFTGGHEMVHVAARHLPRPAGAPETEAFWEEGLAVALAPPTGTPEADADADPPPEPTLRERAAVTARLGLLPSPTALLRRWPEEHRAASRAYRVAGAFVADLAERRGLDAVLRRIAGHDDLASFGVDFAALERDWIERLLETEVAAEVESRVRQSLGLPVETAPADVTEGRPVPLDGELAEEMWIERGDGRWRCDGDVLRASAEKGLASRVLRERLERDVTVSMRLRLELDSTVAVRLHVTDEGSDEVLFGPSDTALTVDGGREGFLRSPVRILPGRWTDVVVACHGETVRVYLDGRLAVEAEGAFRPAPGRAGFSLTAGSRVEIAELRIKSLRR